VTIKWDDFVKATAAAARPTPIDAFYDAHAGMTRLSALLAPGTHLAPELVELLGGQLLLGYVSATELYLRQAIAVAVRVCPLIRRKNRDQMIPFGALDYYPTSALEDSLTERTSFSEPGTIAKQLGNRLGVIVQSKSSLERSIADFERICQLRHSLIHSHGVMNSTNASLFLDAGTAGSRETLVDPAGAQKIAAITVNLVRDVNTELVRTIVWCWIQDGVLTGDRRRDRSRLGRLLGAFASVQDAKAGHPVADVAALTAVVKQVVGQIAASADSGR
jgi:hypothetical protein